MQRRSGGRRLGAVLFTDIVGSTAIAAEMGNTRWGELVARHHRILRRLIGRAGGHEIDTAGDGFFVTFERPADAIRCAVEATEAVRGLGIELRAGVSFGELETFGRKPGGLVVNTAARVMAVAGPGEVLVPASVREIVPGAGITFAEHGVHQLKGLDGEFRLFGVTGIDGREIVPPLEEEEAAERRREIFPAGGRRPALLVGGAAGVLALLVGAWLVWGGRTEEPRAGGHGLRNSVARIDDETGEIGSAVFVGQGGSRFFSELQFLDHPMAVGEGGVWLLRPPRLIHVDPIDRDVRSNKIDIGVGTSQSVAAGFDAVWVLSDRTLYRVHPGTDQTRPFLVLPPAPGIATYSFTLDRQLWVGDSDGTLVRMDPATGARDQAETGLAIGPMAGTGSGLWVADILEGSVTRVDRDSLRATSDRIEIPGSIDQLIGHGDDLWILDAQVGVVTQVDTTTGSVRGSVRVGHESSDIAVGLGALWIGDREGIVYRVDTSTRQVQEFPVPAQVLAVSVDGSSDEVWVYLGRAIANAGG
jgi:class 3 adenylate cyclase/streptogramin lyase